MDIQIGDTVQDALNVNKDLTLIGTVIKILKGTSITDRGWILVQFIKVIGPTYTKVGDADYYAYFNWENHLKKLTNKE